MSTRFSFFHKGIGISMKLETVVKVLGVIALTAWGLYFWAYPSHAMSLFDDSFESDGLRGTWEDYAGCTRGVVQSTDFATHGYWSLSADRTGAEPNCTNQLRTGLGTYSGNTIYLNFDMMATEVNVTIAGVEFLDDTGDAITHAYFQADNIDLDSNDIGVVDNTWYNIRTVVDFVTGCSTSSVDGGSWTTPACGITGDNIAQFRVFAAGTISTILYVDDLSLIASDLVLGSGETLPSEFDEFLGGTPLSISDIIDNYPTHDDIYGSCSIWGGIFSGSTGDGAACIWSWIQYAFTPAEGSLEGLLAATIGTLTTRWPFSYIMVPITTFTDNFHNDECPLPVFLGQEFMGTTLPEFDICTMIDDADYTSFFLDNVWAEAMIIYAIYVGLAVMLFRRAKDFLTGD